MRNMTEAEKLFQKVLEHFGETNQKMKAVEEMSELTKELCKNQFGADNIMEIAEEIADVEIMLEQMVLLFDIKSNVVLQRMYKLKRLAEMVGDEG